jgi:hypothetical protein
MDCSDLHRLLIFLDPNQLVGLDRSGVRVGAIGDRRLQTKQTELHLRREANAGQPLERTPNQGPQSPLLLLPTTA